MLTRKLLLLFAVCVSLHSVSAMRWPWQKKDPKEEEIKDEKKPEEPEPEIVVEPEVPEEPEEVGPRKVPAGVVVSLGKEFLQEEQKALLSSLIYKLDENGQTKTFNTYLSDFVQHTSYPHMQVGVKDFRITDHSNLLTTANLDIEIDAECECVKGKISGV